MKTHLFIGPVLALIGSGYWLSKQHDNIRELTEKTRIIRERIITVEKTSSSATSSLTHSKKEPAYEFTLSDGSLDWQKVAELMVEMHESRGMPTNIKAMLKLREKMMKLTEGELIDGLAKIEDLDLKPKDIDTLKLQILTQLAETNPIAALTALGNPVTQQSNNFYWNQSHIFSLALEKDPNVAIAWLDRHIENGNLDSTSFKMHQDPRLLFERPLMLQLASSDYTTAKDRLNAFSDEEKLHLLSQSHQHIEADAKEAMLKLTRDTLSPEKATEAIISSFGHQYVDDLEKISESLEGLSFTEDERNEILNQRISSYAQITNSDDRYLEIYEWAKTEAPEQSATIVAKALSSASDRWHNPQASFERALKISESQGEPEILTSFVRDFSSQGNKHAVNNQINQFKDPEVAEQYRSLVEAISQETSDAE